MSFSATERFANKKVITWDVSNSLPNSDECSLRLSIDPYEDADLTFPKYFEKFIQQPGIAEIESLLIGSWGEPYDENSSLVVNLLVQHAALLPNLKHLFIGDLALEEAEASWIQQSDISPIYSVFPTLETLKLRGGEGLSLGELKHEKLQSLIIETGGMDNDILGQVASAKLPELSHLELWLGDDNYGCNIETEDVSRLVDALERGFDKLNYLGLCNYYQSDDLVELISSIGFPERITVLDLSNGNLSDKGAQALLNSDKLSCLTTLDLHHHYLSDSMLTRIKAAKLAPIVNVDDQNEADEDDDETYRYIFVAE